MKKTRTEKTKEVLNALLEDEFYDSVENVRTTLEYDLNLLLPWKVKVSEIDVFDKCTFGCVHLKNELNKDEFLHFKITSKSLN